MNMKKIRKVIIIICVMVIFVDIVQLINGSDTINYKVDAKLAKPIIIVEKDDIIKNKISESSFPIEYNFCIKNYNESEVNDATLEYVISFENSKNNFPIKYTLIDENNNQEINLVEGKSEKFSLKKNEKEIRRFKLIVEWQELNIELADKMEIKLKIEAVQEEKDEA